MLGAVKILVVGGFILFIMLVVIIYFSIRLRQKKKGSLKKQTHQKKLADAKAYLTLGTLYEGNAEFQKDLAQASQFYQRAALLDNNDAKDRLTNLSSEYSDKLLDESEFVKRCLHLTQYDHAEAFYLLGRFYEEGTGTTQDDEQALKWFKRAADHGHAESQWILGMKYENGDGVSTDIVKAYKWLCLGAEKMKYAEEERYDLAFMLTESQRKEAEVLLTQWKEEH